MAYLAKKNGGSSWPKNGLLSFFLEAVVDQKMAYLAKKNGGSS